LLAPFSPAAVLARTSPTFRIVGEDVKRFIVVDDVRLIGETVENDDTVVAANAATNTIRNEDMVLDEFIVIVLVVIAR
jgi:hypothetical protein